jgi:hypothetical protein
MPFYGSVVTGQDLRVSLKPAHMDIVRTFDFVQSFTRCRVYLERGHRRMDQHPITDAILPRLRELREKQA